MKSAGTKEGGAKLESLNVEFSGFHEGTGAGKKTTLGGSRKACLLFEIDDPTSWSKGSFIRDGLERSVEATVKVDFMRARRNFLSAVPLNC